jgi:hypothetical protein
MPARLFIDPADADLRVRPAHGSGIEEHAMGREYFGRSEEVRAGPRGFLVERTPTESTVPAHFHSTDQFQVFFPSAGAWYQRQRIETPLLHYADAYLVYGPFGSGSEPLCFFTLCPVASTITGYMPGARDKLIRRGRRHVKVDLAPRLGQRPRRARCTRSA